MKKESIIDCERNSLEKLSKYQLPNSFKKIGFGLFWIGLPFLLANKLLGFASGLTLFIKYEILIGLLIVSISKEKVEDELITKLRMQSYAFAFISGVLFSLVLPVIDFLFDFLFARSTAIFNSMSDWSILWMLLSVQVFYFELLKRLHK